MHCACAVLHWHLWPARPYYIHVFRTLSLTWHDFHKQVTEHKMCFLIFSTILSETFLILRRNERDVIKNLCWSSCEAPLFLSYFHETWILSANFRKDTQISNFIKIRPVGAELFLADGRTDIQAGRHAWRSQPVPLRSFANAPTTHPFYVTELVTNFDI